MNPKEDISKKHFYTFCLSRKTYIKKSEGINLFLFYEFIEKTLNEFPKIENKDFEIIRLFLNNIYYLISIPEENKNYLKYVVYLERKAEEMEKEGLKIVKNFIDFSKIDDKEIKELNNLRINLRILEILFWNIIKNKELPDNSFYLVIPHFLNVSSKYVFYYIVLNYKDKLKYLERLKLDIEFDENLYKKYLEAYKDKKLYDYI